MNVYYTSRFQSSSIIYFYCNLQTRIISHPKVLSVRHVPQPPKIAATLFLFHNSINQNRKIPKHVPFNIIRVFFLSVCIWTVVIIFNRSCTSPLFRFVYIIFSGLDAIKTQINQWLGPKKLCNHDHFIIAYTFAYKFPYHLSFCSFHTILINY